MKALGLNNSTFINYITNYELICYIILILVIIESKE